MISSRFLFAVLAWSTVLAGAGQASAQSSRGEEVIYVIRPGDTFDKLARAYFTSPAASRQIMRINGIRQERRVPIGKRIRIPKSVLRGVPLDATILTFSGSVSLTSEGRSSQASKGSPVRAGTVVATGPRGFATVAIRGSGNVSVPSNSQVRFISLRRLLINDALDIDMRVETGRVEAKVNKSSQPANSYRVRTPVSVSAVRGTVFRVGYEGPASPGLTEVLEGTVAAAGPSDGSELLVGQGRGAIVPSKGEPVVEALLPAPQMRSSDKIQKDPVVRFNFSAVDKAVSYRVQIARDAGFLDVIEDVRSTTPSVTVSALDDGNYFVRASAVAPSGLEGMTDVFAFRRRLASVTGSSESLGEFNYKFVWNAEGQGRPVYRFQLFGPRDKTTPIVDEVGLTEPEIAVGNLGPGRYSWRVAVRLHASEGAETSWSSFSEFVVSE